jgi:hypothetical protein
MGASHVVISGLHDLSRNRHTTIRLTRSHRHMLPIGRGFHHVALIRLWLRHQNKQRHKGISPLTFSWCPSILAMSDDRATPSLGADGAGIDSGRQHRQDWPEGRGPGHGQ